MFFKRSQDRYPIQAAALPAVQPSGVPDPTVPQLLWFLLLLAQLLLQPDRLWLPLVRPVLSPVPLLPVLVRQLLQPTADTHSSRVSYPFCQACYMPSIGCQNLEKVFPNALGLKRTIQRSGMTQVILCIKTQVGSGYRM